MKHLGTYSLSLCGGLSDPDGVTLEKFMSKIVTYDDLRENPNMLTNPELVIRVGHKYYNWSTAAPIILSQIAFQKSLPEVKSHVTFNMSGPSCSELKMLFVNLLLKALIIKYYKLIILLTKSE